MSRKVYVNTYRETVIGEDAVIRFESGVFDHGFVTLQQAKESLFDIAMRRLDEFEEDDVMSSTEKWNDDKTSITLVIRGNTYEYAAKEVEIDE